jgi:hypothetical protein
LIQHNDHSPGLRWRFMEPLFDEVDAASLAFLRVA